MALTDNLGKKVRLMVVKEVEFGVYLGNSQEKVLLPKKQVPRGIEIGDPEEWCTYREQILNTNSCLGIKFRFLEFEELYDRLLKTIVESGSIYTLDQYEKVLKKKFPDIIRDTYVNYVRKHAESVCDRKAYKGLMTYLKKITKYPDGRGKADQIAKEWKVIYRRRPAMMDELKKAGF